MTDNQQSIKEQIKTPADLAKWRRYNLLLKELRESGGALSANKTKEISRLQRYFHKPDAESERDYDSEREYHVEYNKKLREAERDIGEIPHVKNQKRRKKCRLNLTKFAETYFPNLLYNPLTDDHKVQLGVLQRIILGGGQQAIACCRGDGKTTRALIALMWGMLYNHIRFGLLISANATEATTNLADIRAELEGNELLLEDFPEVCHPISFITSPQRATGLTYKGKSLGIVWKTSRIVLPSTTGKLGAVVRSCGIGGQVRGQRIKINGLVIRPDFVLIDDPDSELTAYSSTMQASRGRIFKKVIPGLAGQGKSVAVAMLCTIIARGATGDVYTDPQREPAWNGLRQKFIYTFPDRLDLWNEYVMRRRACMQTGDEFAKDATQFYLENRKAMDAGAVLSNLYNYIVQTGEDGLQREVSALQHYYNFVADHGLNAALCELQNDPPEEEKETSEIELEIPQIQNKGSGYARGFIPDWAERLTIGTDLGKNYIHTVIAAWKQGGEGAIIDYRILNVNSPMDSMKDDTNIQRAVDEALLTALREFYEQIKGGYKRGDGLLIPAVWAIDGGWRELVAQTFARELKHIARDGFKIIQTKGWAGSNYHHPRQKTSDKIPGNYWNASWQNGYYLYNFNSDFWKRFVQEGFLITLGQNNSLSLFEKTNQVNHEAYAKSIISETWHTEFKPGKGETSKFIVNYKENHFLDATALAAVSASVCGIKIGGQQIGGLMQDNPQTSARTEPEKNKAGFINQARKGGSWLGS